MNTESRIAHLETLVTEQELLLEQYSDLIRGQQKQLDQLSQKMQLLELRLSRFQETGEFDSGNEVPPHY